MLFQKQTAEYGLLGAGKGIEELLQTSRGLPEQKARKGYTRRKDWAAPPTKLKCLTANKTAAVGCLRSEAGR